MWIEDEHGEKRTRFEALFYRCEAWEDVRGFYRDVLGLKEIHVDEADGWAQFSLDAGPAIHLMRGGLPNHPPGVAAVGLRFSELDSLRERLSRAGIDCEIRQDHQGITRLRFIGPEGHHFAAYRWEIKDAVKPFSVQGVASDERGHVLVVLSGDRWALPGGVVDEHEGPLETLEREFVEEVGVRPAGPRLSGVYHIPNWDGIRMVFRCGLDGVPKAGAEVREYRFVDLERLRDMAPPWIVDRVLDAVEVGEGAVVRTQRTDSITGYVSPRSQA